MEEKEIIGKIKLLRKIQPEKNWLVFCRSELIKKINQGVAEQSSAITRSFAWLLQNKFWSPLFRPAVVALIIILTLGFGGLVTVKAALKSLPGDFLYPIKITLERIEMRMVSDESEKAKMEAEITGRRVQELTEIISQPLPAREESIQEVVEQIERQLSSTNSQLPKLKEKAKIEGKSSEKLVEVAKKVKENTSKLEQALSQAKSNLSENKILSAKISDISDMAKETNNQILEILETVENLETFNIPTGSESTSSPSLITD